MKTAGLKKSWGQASPVSSVHSFLRGRVGVQNVVNAELRWSDRRWGAEGEGMAPHNSCYRVAPGSDQGARTLPIGNAI